MRMKIGKVKLALMVWNEGFSMNNYLIFTSIFVKRAEKITLETKEKSALQTIPPSTTLIQTACTRSKCRVV